MNYRVSWPKAQIQKAGFENKSLFAVAYNGKAGRMESYGPCGDIRAAIAFRVAHLIHMGNSLDEAVATTKEDQKRFEEKHPDKKDPENIACI